MFCYRINFERKNAATGQPVWVIFECQIADLETFVATLNEGKLVIGRSMFVKSKKDNDGPFYEVTSEQVLAIGKSGVSTIEPVTQRVIRYVE